MRSGHVAVIGAGLMGHGIAFLFARAGHEVRVQEPSAAMRESLPERVGALCDLLGADRALLTRIQCHAELEPVASGAAVVIEAAPEQLALKRALFVELERFAPANAILASNTSSIPIAAISAGLEHRARVIGAHFWNPPHLVALVEVIMPQEINRPAAEELIGLLRAIGRHPVLVRRDVPGCIGNRLQHALKREAIALVAAGVCDAETIDDVAKYGFGARLAVLGPLEQSDLVGLDLTRQIHQQLMPDLDVTATVHPYLESLVQSGELGMKTGKGFRRWTPETAQAVRERLSRFLLRAQRPAD
jgi:3-hydroxybutyryl-CoA dehydrogenase